MELNDIKKRLYKENPTANLIQVRDAKLNYSTSLDNGNTVILFTIPMEETKGADFFSNMDSKHLIRWIDSHISDIE